MKWADKARRTTYGMYQKHWAEPTAQLAGGEITGSQWAAATGKGPGTLEYAAHVGYSPVQFAEMVSGLQSEIRRQAAPAMKGVTATGSGYVDPAAISGVSSRMQAAQTVGMAMIERGNLQYRQEARSRWEQYKRERRQRILGTFMDIVGLAMGGVVGYGVSKALQPQAGFASMEGVPELQFAPDFWRGGV